MQIYFEAQDGQHVEIVQVPDATVRLAPTGQVYQCYLRWPEPDLTFVQARVIDLMMKLTAARSQALQEAAKGEGVG